MSDTILLHDDRNSELPQVSVTGVIEASPAELWSVISAPGNLELAHPYCERNPVTVWPGPGSRDEVHYLSGWVYRREFTDWIDGVGYDLRIGSQGEQRSVVTWRIEPDGSRRTAFTITIRPRPIDRVPAVLQRPVQLGYVRPLLRRYLGSVVAGFDWYLRTGTPVSHNQFGRHPWFSGPRRRSGSE